jgi:hypothetical protein
MFRMMFDVAQAVPAIACLRVRQVGILRLTHPLTARNHTDMLEAIC